MPLGGIVGGLLEWIIHLFGYVISDVLIEVLIKGMGYTICRPFSKSVNPDGILVVLVGFVGWAAIVGSIVVAYSYLSA